NADFIIDLLGEDNINQRMDELELEHDHIVPIAGSLAADSKYKQEHEDWETELQNMSDRKYRELAFYTLQDMKQEDIDLSPVSEVSLSQQRIWSDILTNAPAATYGK